jgi:hypothetical protein
MAGKLLIEVGSDLTFFLGAIMFLTGVRQLVVGSEETTDDGLVRIICSEFREMPGMRLSRAQFRRLWDLTESDCQRVLDQLIGSGFLAESRHGQFGRPVDV